jgi:uncharacterized SAM-binding protein YcdF (DUF218 family)
VIGGGETAVTSRRFCMTRLSQKLSLARWAAALTAGVGLAVAGAEWMHWKASRRYLGPGPASGDPAPAGSQAVIVLGCPSRRDGGTRPVQRWRCQIAARSAGPGPRTQLIFTGAATGDGPSEAAVMSGYARDVLGVPDDQLVLETRARSTWQNVAFTVPLAEHADVIKIASDPLHAARARRYLRAQRPDLTSRVSAAADYRFGDHILLKVLTAGYELVRVFAVRRPGLAALLRADRR